MSLQFLQRISPLIPYETEKPGEIDHIAILKAGGLVIATIPEALPSAQYSGSARVTALTRDGGAALALIEVVERAKKKRALDSEP